MGMGLAGDGGRRSVIQDASDVGDADVGRAAGVCSRDHSLLDPATDGVLADMVASVGQVAVHLTDGACLESVSFHSGPSISFGIAIKI